MNEVSRNIGRDCELGGEIQSQNNADDGGLRLQTGAALEPPRQRKDATSGGHRAQNNTPLEPPLRRDDAPRESPRRKSTGSCSFAQALALKFEKARMRMAHPNFGRPVLGCIDTDP